MELSAFGKIAPYGALVLVQLIVSTNTIVCEVIFVQGTSSIVFLFYEFMASTLSMGVLAFIFERSTLSQILTLSALYFITSALLSSVSNTMAVVTYTLALITRQEKLHFRTLWEYGKIFGTLLSVAGALTLILWHQSSAVDFTSTNRALGLIMVIVGVVCSSAWILMLEPVMRSYPAELSMTTITMFFATIQTGLVAALANHNFSQWQLHWDLELLNIFVGGVLCTGLCNFLYAWCAKLKSPVVLASFAPLGTLFTTVAEILFLGHGSTLGSAIGSILIVVGLYMYLWSKSKEEAQEIVHDAILISPLLHNEHSDHIDTGSKV